MQHIITASRSFGLVPEDNIRCTVHMVPANVGIKLLRHDVQRINKVGAFRDGRNDWTKDVFYLNIFFGTKTRFIISLMTMQINHSEMNGSTSPLDMCIYHITPLSVFTQ